MLSLDGGNTPPITRKDLPRSAEAAVYDMHNIGRSARNGSRMDKMELCALRELDFRRPREILNQCCLSAQSRLDEKQTTPSRLRCGLVANQSEGVSTKARILLNTGVRWDSCTGRSASHWLSR
jgi:hypothetical protein